ncbi:DUF4105 domain-containing protein [Acinetobacter sichuanensis]|uniref:DUF4105 domain-containing protein n=1 Tax=Acinetobacter sichuanensis TaxID=2136183 RepID=A0A371YUN8_9GAMM|nr:DUF4105 domain-containing protein [Acinetobacter sichuanensis]RFC85180.1 DUF4105 domain-containing protein [Acinetobacter sichuanensis]
MQKIKKKSLFHALGMGLIHSIFSIFVIFSSIWLCCALWFQAPFGLFSRIMIGLWILFAFSILGIYIKQNLFSRHKDILIYILAFLCSLLWYFNIPAKQDREWNPEVDRLFTYKKQGNIVTIHNIRNFNWHTENKYDVHWDTRSYNLEHITGVNIITSYWMGPQIAHTLVSFDFSDQKPLVFSIEIRKEKTESFSAIGGFFRKYELSLIAADEKDLIYTRSNIRNEQVYFFPVKMPKTEMKALFTEYLEKTDELAQQAKWYNTLSSNCTTLVFDMVQAISPHELPLDYRLLASGYLPNYLYDLGALNQQWTIKQWYQRAHVNPRTDQFKHFEYQSSENYSKVIREGLTENIHKGL